jgi:hypothetical protein
MTAAFLFFVLHTLARPLICRRPSLCPPPGLQPACVLWGWCQRDRAALSVSIAVRLPIHTLFLLYVFPSLSLTWLDSSAKRRPTRDECFMYFSQHFWTHCMMCVCVCVRTKEWAWCVCVVSA